MSVIFLYKVSVGYRANQVNASYFVGLVMDAVASASIVVSGNRNLGNIQYAASVIQKNTNTGSFRIQPRQAYPTDHSTLVSMASEEQEQDARPQIRNTLKKLSSYDTIFIGYAGGIIGLN